jgi:hypothetical protein
MKILTLERQIETLARYGISLNPGIMPEDLLSNEYPRDSFESAPFEMLIYRFDHSLENEERQQRFSDRVAYLDAGFYEGLDGYFLLVSLQNPVTSGVLNIEECRSDLVAHPEQEGEDLIALILKVGGEEVVFHYAPRAYVDLAGVLGNFNELLERAGSRDRIVKVCDNGEAGVYAALPYDMLIPFFAETGLRSRTHAAAMVAPEFAVSDLPH